MFVDCNLVLNETSCVIQLITNVTNDCGYSLFENVEALGEGN